MSGVKNKSLVKVAFIANAHGIRGQVKLRSLTASPDDLKTIEEFYDEAGKRRFKIRLQGATNKEFIAAIDGIVTRNEAEALKGTQLFADPKYLPKKGENEWFHSELIGLSARLTDGAEYGKITAAHNFGAGDILEIALANGKTEMLPFRSPFIGDIHKEKGYIIVNPPAYLEAKSEQ
jgi:16S rRNA processing protein RimM